MPQSIDILIEDDRWEALALLPLATRVLTPLFQDLGLSGQVFELCILGCDDAKITELNAEFRDKPKPTNVLSWPSFDLAPLVAGEKPALPPVDTYDKGLGDIAISFDTCALEATAAGKDLSDHVTHLILHGALHLLGYDHETDADAKRMESLETRLLAKLGIDDPYYLSDA